MTAILLIFFLICAAALVIAWVDGHRYVIRHYTVRSSEITRKYTLVFLTDQHGTVYGGNNDGLIDDIRKQEPDAVLIGGDFLNSRDMNGENDARGSQKGKQHRGQMLDLAAKLAAAFPVFAAQGNHELYAAFPEGKDEEKNRESREHYSEYEKELRQTGVTLLINERADMGELSFWGFSADRKIYRKFSRCRLTDAEIRDKLGPSAPAGRFNIVLSHHPYHFERISQWGADLVLSGHFHGGVLRLPGIGGVISPEPRLFPRYSGGIYHLPRQADGTASGTKQPESTMVVSCGIGTHSLCLRIFNPAEVAVIHLEPASFQ